MLTDKFYFVPAAALKKTWTSFASTDLVGLGTAAQEIEAVISSLQALSDEQGTEVRCASAHAEQVLRFVLIRIFRTERKTIHFRKEAVVFPRGGGKPYLELTLYTSTVRIPVEWLIESAPVLAAEIAQECKALSDLLPVKRKV